MLRKRASFKPNLKQVSSSSSSQQQQQPPQQSQTPNAPSSTTTTTTETTVAPVAGATAGAALQSTSSSSNQQQQQQQPQQQQQHQPNEGSKELAANGQQAATNQASGEAAGRQELASGVSKQRIEEAITQLTGQKFEPIKLLSLRSSANKNVKIKDLLFLNPPMTKDQKRHKKSVYLAKKNELKKSQAGGENGGGGGGNKNGGVGTNMANNNTSEEPSLVPKVKMGPEGQLILDESSTIINRKNAIKEQEAIVEDNEEIISKTNYDSFRRRPTNTSQTKWSTEDTKKFYQALTILGTDFSMMESLLFSGHRSRTELHKKFKREERVNKPKVDMALSNRISLNSEELEDLKEIFYK